MGNVQTERARQQYELTVFGQDVLLPRRKMELNLTQTQMAQLIGVDQATVWRIEDGRRPKDRATVEAFVAAYRLSRAEKNEWLRLLYGYETGQDPTEFVEYPPLSEEFDDVIAELEKQPGDRFMFKAGPSVLLTPLDVVEERAHQISARGDLRTASALDRAVAHRKRRHAVFRQQHNSLFRDIYSRRGFEHWVDTGSYSADDTIARLGGEPPTPLQLLRVLRHMVDILTENHNYQAGFMRREDERPIQAYVAIKPGKAVLLQSLEKGLRGAAKVRAGFVITEPSTVEAHLLRFHALWEKAQTDKAEVINYLQQLMMRVERRM